MIPYATFTYFGVLLYPLVPTVVLGLLGRISWRWVLLVTVAMFAVQYGGQVGILPRTAVTGIWLVGGFALFEYLVARSFLWLRAREASPVRWVFYTALLLTLLPLALAKLVPLLAPGSFLGFLGISYITFRSLDVIFGIQDHLITTLPLGEYFAFLFFFATISSGPIDRYRRFILDWRRQRTRGEFLQDLDAGVHRIFIGFLYKFILAALIKQYWLDPVTAGTDLASTFSYMYAYSFYLFFDFAGYSAFAIGVSYFFGIHTPENFVRPFIAENIGDFWNRWHISLSTWFRDHVYMRFTIAATKQHWFKNKYLASYLGFFLAFGLMGLWHGTALNYIAYGLYHGALLSTHSWFERWNRPRHLWGQGRLWRAAGIFITFNLVCFGFLLFSGRLGPASPVIAGSGPQYDGALESADCVTIRGWARRTDQPNQPILLNVYDGDIQILSAVPADQPRPDLKLPDDGKHGFSADLPPVFKDGKPHSLSVQIMGTDIQLQNSPRVITCQS